MLSCSVKMMLLLIWSMCLLRVKTIDLCVFGHDSRTGLFDPRQFGGHGAIGRMLPVLWELNRQSCTAWIRRTRRGRSCLGNALTLRRGDRMQVKLDFC